MFTPHRAQAIHKGKQCALTQQELQKTQTLATCSLMHGEFTDGHQLCALYICLGHRIHKTTSKLMSHKTDWQKVATIQTEQTSHIQRIIPLTTTHQQCSI